MVSYRRVWSPAQVIVLAAGVLFLVFGAIAVINAGLTEPLTEPVVRVFGFDHTALLGVFELCAGALLVLSALAGSRTLSVVLSVLLVVGGVMILAEEDWTMTHLTGQSEFGWVPVISGGVCLLALMLMREVRRGRTVVR
jgi:hypothetical protein